MGQAAITFSVEMAGSLQKKLIQSRAIAKMFPRVATPFGPRTARGEF
jgi:hypothetical protein